MRGRPDSPRPSLSRVTASTSLTPTKRYGFLGPEGTFTSMALDAWGPSAQGERVTFGSVDAALTALRAGSIDAAMVPIENLSLIHI